MQAAKLALGLLCGAHISAVQNEPVVGVMKHFGGEVARQHPLHTLMNWEVVFYFQIAIV